jgi:hypothetical protein
MIPFVSHVQDKKILETESKYAAGAGRVDWEQESDCLLGTGLPFGVMEMFYN